MVPTSWNEIKSTVQKLNPEFYEAIEEVRPDPNLKMHILEYQYGELITDEHYTYIPDGKGNTLHIPKPLPQMFLLEGMIDLYFEANMGSILWDTFRPGKVFPTIQYAEDSIASPFSPNKNFKLTAGIRNAYMLQLHAFNEYYANLKKHYHIPNEFKPTNPLDHYKIFRDIAQKEQSPWRVRVLLFDNKWLEHIWQNPKWLKVQTYFYKNSLQLTSPWNWSLTFHQALRDISRFHNFKLKDYSEDMIRQILFTASGALSAFIPACDERALPFNTLVNAFNEFYGTHNLPVIMHAWRSNTLGETKYLSVSQNTATTYDIKTYRPLEYLHEIKEYLPQYLKHFQTHLMTHDTIYGKMQGRLKIEYYSEKGVEAEGILPARDLQSDPRIVAAYQQYRLNPEQTFPERAPFLKAFVGFTFT